MPYIENTLTVKGVTHNIKHLEAQTLQNILDVNSGVNGNGLKSALIEYSVDEGIETLQYNNFQNNDFLGEIMVYFTLILRDLEGDIIGSTAQPPQPVRGQDYLDWLNSEITYIKVNKSMINYMLNYAYGVKSDGFEVRCFDRVTWDFYQPIIFTCSVNNDLNLEILATDSSGGLSYSLDGVNYQASNIFEDEQGGLKTVFVKDSSNRVNTRSYNYQPF
jgi:hypothetical protein